ncbi:hypothetical protein BDR07DRAFT_558368 [Suillus spraguei]|nr:hypothetical protein BDR07DRAFT_558368 [Suillus spraguei]
MTTITNDPSLWPLISGNIFYNHWTIAAGVVVLYDWVLTLGQEIELIWRQRWSLITVLYLVIRYIGIPYSVINFLVNMPFISVTNTVSNIMFYVVNLTSVIVAAILGVIMITRLHAMYRRSGTMLIFLIVIFLAVNIACLVIAAIALRYQTTMEELVLDGTYMCNYEYGKNYQLMFLMVWMLITVWEILALCLSVWIAVKHFRDMRRLGPPTGGYCFGVMMKYHVLYFVSFIAVSCFQFINYSPELMNSNFTGTLILYGALQILFGVQRFVLGPRLILSVREYHTKLVANSAAESTMNLIVLRERVHV